VGIDTRRAEDGLAMSSRNGYLNAEERQQAVLLSQCLKTVADGIRSGRSDYAALEAQAMSALASAGWKPDYVVARRRVDLQAPQPGDALVVLAAAKLGNTRLIDNLEV
jgi:pantoate--beta-alanine ligase